MNSQFYTFLTLLAIGMLFYMASRYFDDQSLRVVSFIMFGVSLPALRDARVR